MLCILALSLVKGVSLFCNGMYITPALFGCWLANINTKFLFISVLLLRQLD